MPALELSRAGAAQDERQTAGLDQAVDFVQQLGDFLDLVQDDGGAKAFLIRRGQPFGEQGGSFGQAQDEVGIEEVEDDALGKTLLQISGFSGLARAPQERRLAPGKGEGKDP